MRARKPLETRYGYLTIFPEEREYINGALSVRSVCDCGKECWSQPFALRKGTRRSCGCTRIGISLQKVSHKHPLYRTWVAMRNRCSNPNHEFWDRYGGRGIRVCEKWDDFWKFAEDMGDRPDGFSIERKNNDLGYSPDNCIWADKRDQNSNTRKNIKVTYLGMTGCLKAVAAHHNLNYHRALYAIRKGMKPDEALRFVHITSAG